MRNPCRQRRFLSSQPCRPVRSGVMRNPLARPKRLQKKPDPVRPNPHRDALQRTAFPRIREPVQRRWPYGLARCPQRKNPPTRRAGSDKLEQAQRRRRVVQYLRKQVSYATISVTHSGTSIGRLAQRERRCLTSTRSQVQILYRPPLKSQVRHFLSDLFFFQGNQGKQVPDKLATIGHASLPPKRRAHKNGRRLAPTPENQRAFALKARLSNTGTRTRLQFYGSGMHRRPDENPPYAPQARFLHANPKGPPAQPTTLKLCDFHLAARKPR